MSVSHLSKIIFAQFVAEMAAVRRYSPARVATVPSRKRKRAPGEVDEKTRHQSRKEKNRQHAQASRERRKAHIMSLEARKNGLFQEKRALERSLFAEHNALAYSARHGRGALHAAARDGKTMVVSALLRASCDPTLRDDGGNTPLMVARLARRDAVVELLLKAEGRVGEPGNETARARAIPAAAINGRQA